VDLFGASMPTDVEYLARQFGSNITRLANVLALKAQRIGEVRESKARILLIAQLPCGEEREGMTPIIRER
jgi:hypothetical protein